MSNNALKEGDIVSTNKSKIFHHIHLMLLLGNVIELMCCFH